MFGKIIKRSLAISTFLLMASGTEVMAQSSTANVNNGYNDLNMHVFGSTRPPIGHVQFCRSHPGECKRTHSGRSGYVKLTKGTWRDLTEVNSFVNRSVRPVTDMDLYRTVENWTYPQGAAGDCEDYVLLKRRMLIERGWPEGSLLITVVRDEHGDGHAILTVTTSGGDFVLDNRIQTVLRWNQTPYQFVKRQSAHHPRKWVSLVPKTNKQLSAAIGALRLR